MPTYEYVCSKCDRHFDLVQSITENPIATCPKELCACKPWGKGRVKRVIGLGAGIIFKGSGFYVTDYRSEGYKQAAKKESESAAPPKSQSKSAEASEAAAKPAKPSGSSSGKP